MWCFLLATTEVHNSNILVCGRTSWGLRFAKNGRQVGWTSGIFRSFYEPLSTCNGSNTIVWCWSGQTANCRKKWAQVICSSLIQKNCSQMYCYVIFDFLHVICDFHLANIRPDRIETLLKSVKSDCCGSVGGVIRAIWVLFMNCSASKWPSPPAGIFSLIIKI